jgi:sugar lactone lactonase YvrE
MCIDPFVTQLANQLSSTTDPGALSCSAANVVLTSVGVASSTTLTTSTSAVAPVYVWEKDGVTIPAETTANLFIGSGTLATGNYNFRVSMTDSGVTSTCDWTVKQNAAPVIGSVNPTTTPTFRMNWGTPSNFDISATDANGDSLTYSWGLNSASSPALPSTTTNATLTPDGSVSLGNHAITVTVSDGIESTEQTWNINVNQFSDACNALYSGSVASTGGKICTLAGKAGVGAGDDVTANPTLARIKPIGVATDDSGNIYFSDPNLHTVFLYNRSAAPLIRHGVLSPAGSFVRVAGSGANGKSPEFASGSAYKLYSPKGLAYDPLSQKLYIADGGNNRVVEVDASGISGTVLGGASHAPGPGTGHSCLAPQDVEVMTIQGVRTLVAACTSSHKIVALDLDGGSAGQARILVGRLNGVPINSSNDGFAGPGGEATTLSPYGLGSDSQETLYWTERTNNRVRAVNLSAVPRQFGTYPSVTPASGVSLSAVDLALPVTLLAASKALIAKSPLGGADRWAISTSTNIGAGICWPIWVSLKNGTDPAALGGTTSGTLTSDDPLGNFSDDAGCSVLQASLNFDVPSGKSGVLVYYQSSSPLYSTTLTASGNGLTDGLFTGTVMTPLATANSLDIGMESSFNSEGCVPFIVSMANASSPATSASAEEIQLTTNNIGSFYSDDACVNQVSRASFAALEPFKILYYSRTIHALPNMTVGLLGYAGSGASNQFTGQGATRIASPSDVEAFEPGGTFAGIFVSSSAATKVIAFVNMSTSLVQMGGNAFNPLGGSGQNHQSGIAIGFNTTRSNDGLPGVSTSVESVDSIEIWGDSLIYGDTLGARVRSMDVVVPVGTVQNVVGSGSGKSAAAVHTTFPAPDSPWNEPITALMDPDGNALYVSEAKNNRIAKIDLLTGRVTDEVYGTFGQAHDAGESDPTNFSNVALKGMSWHGVGPNKTLLFVDGSSSAGATNYCLVRAYNRGPSTASLFGTNVSAGKIQTVAGEYGSLGCGPYTSNGLATGTRLYNPTAVASDGTNLYVTNTASTYQAILKIDPSGTTSVYAGNTGASGLVDGNLAAGRMNGLTEMIADPLYPGNLFIADQRTNTLGRIRYINSQAVSVTVGAVSVPAGSPSDPYLGTIWNVNAPATQSQPLGLAIFEGKICWTSGTSDGNTGLHSIFCADRGSGAAPVRILGPADTTVRGGSQVGREDEGVYASGVQLWGPTGLSFDTDGNLYVVEQGGHSIRMIRRWF